MTTIYKLRMGENSIVSVPPAERRRVLGVRGQRLHEIAGDSLPVRPGFTVPLKEFLPELVDWQVPRELRSLINAGIRDLQEAGGAKLGEGDRPLVLSFRLEGLAKKDGRWLQVGEEDIEFIGMDPDLARVMEGGSPPWLGWFIWGKFLSGMAPLVCEDLDLSTAMRKAELAAVTDRDLLDIDPASDLDEATHVKETREILLDYGGNYLPPSCETILAPKIAPVRNAFLASRGITAPTLPLGQLHWAILAAVSRRNRWLEKFKEYQSTEDTAMSLTVQKMVYAQSRKAGGMVFFTRSPVSGEKTPDFEILSDDLKVPGLIPASSAKNVAADVRPEIQQSWIDRLERREPTLLDVTVIHDGLGFYLEDVLPRPDAAPAAKVRIFVEMAEEGLISRGEALARLPEDLVEQAKRLEIAADAPKRIIAKGRGWNDAVVSGRVALTLTRARLFGLNKVPFIFMPDFISSDESARINILRAVAEKEPLAAPEEGFLLNDHLMNFCDGAEIFLPFMRGAIIRTWEATMRPIDQVPLAQKSVPSFWGFTSAELSGLGPDQEVTIEVRNQTATIYKGRLPLVTKHPDAIAAHLEKLAAWRAAGS